MLSGRSRHDLRTRAADLCRDGFPRSYATDVPGGRVSTLLRESSSFDPAWYYETMAFLWGVPGIPWMSAASHAQEADRQHDLAVRWFNRG